MRDEFDAILDDLLARWHRYAEAYRFTKGYSGVSSTTRDYRVPTHWDHRNGAEDERAEKIVMQQVDEAVNRVPNDPQPWRLALAFQARNLATGRTVWASPRLPRGEELETLTIEARTKLMRELYREGVMT